MATYIAGTGNKRHAIHPDNPGQAVCKVASEPVSPEEEWDPGDLDACGNCAREIANAEAKNRDSL